jgi:hypothetical protein
MADIIEVILADHKRSQDAGCARRRRELRRGSLRRLDAGPCVVQTRRPPRAARRGRGGDLLSGPVRAGQAATAHMQDAIADHDHFREEVREAGLHAAGSALWWRAVASALWASSDHVAREQRGARAAFGCRAAPALRNELCRHWAPFTAARTRDATPETRIGATRDRALYYAPGRSCCSC